MVVPGAELQMRAYFSARAFVQLVAEGGGAFPAHILASLNSPKDFAEMHEHFDECEELILTTGRAERHALGA